MKRHVQQFLCVLIWFAGAVVGNVYLCEASAEEQDELIGFYNQWFDEATQEQPRLRNLVKAYQEVNHYEAKWELRNPVTNEIGDLEAWPIIQIAFDRKAGLILYRISVPDEASPDEPDHSIGTRDTVIFDGTAVHLISDDGHGNRSHNSLPIEGDVAFEQFHRVFPFALTPDLALLISNMPVMRIMQTTPDKVNEVAETDEDYPGVYIHDEFGEISAFFGISDEHHLVKLFRLERLDAPEASVILKLVELQTDHPIDDQVFAPTTYLP
ncbi:hypothetical protein ACERK3_10460 [Phycisphaerales bacterium AB-hyl4]|uniref:Uncharacterized protein n=1 Tax=Natronomicrosphaera hydrolytica TaxID=3242702 RepID=A0ABV4U874_9BACT